MNITDMTGSFNWSVQAVRQNQENLLIIENQDLVKKYQEQYEILWNQFAPRTISIEEGKQKFEEEKKKREETKLKRADEKKKWKNKQKKMNLKIIL